ncbi:MAG: phosphoadenosine phosphosulfate reductase [Caulobacteraceae bacterium]|nr:phosphoadenosine phosphosulfate reductase [Caulobacteraceae bacterium]
MSSDIRLFTDGTPAKAIFSFGGGVQSHAVLALAAQGRVRYDAFVFANVGNDSENPDTLEYMNSVTKPFCERNSLTLIEVQKSGATLRDAAMRPDRKSVLIPAYVEGGGMTPRSCTTDWKIRIIDRWCKSQAWPHIVVGLGISTDEWQRARDTAWHDAYETEAGNRRPFGFWKAREYPLLNLRINRTQAHRIITEAGLPTPPKSSCYFCPFKRPGEWVEMKHQDPELFAKAVELEDSLNSKGLPHTYRLHPSRRELREAVADQLPLFPSDDDRCDSGYCWT